VIWPLIFRALYAEQARGDDNDATSLYERAIAAARASGDPRLVAIATNNLGNIALRQRNYAYAARLFDEAFALGHVDDGPVYCMNLAQTLYRAERSGEAAAAAREGLALAHEAGNLMAIEIGFLVLAAIACEKQDFGRGARLLGAHDALWGVGREPLYEEADLVEATTSTAVNALGEEEYAAALAGGKAMSLDDAVRYALSP
jgi:tetratricopeptide (TPR) repeat protein